MTASSDLARMVGKPVELTGVVTRSKCPQVLGIDVWALESYRGRSVRISGILSQEVVTQAQIDATARERGGPSADRGPGTYYHLDDMKFELLP